MIVTCIYICGTWIMMPTKEEMCYKYSSTKSLCVLNVYDLV